MRRCTGRGTAADQIFASLASVAGFVGSAITVFGVSLGDRDFRDANSWFRTIAIGALAGLLLHDGYLLKLLGLSWVVEEHYRLKEESETYS
jgi:hypothetical protein